MEGTERRSLRNEGCSYSRKAQHSRPESGAARPGPWGLQAGARGVSGCRRGQEIKRTGVHPGQSVCLDQRVLTSGMLLPRPPDKPSSSPRTGQIPQDGRPGWEEQGPLWGPRHEATPGECRHQRPVSISDGSLAADAADWTASCSVADWKRYVRSHEKDRTSLTWGLASPRAVQGNEVSPGLP